MAKVNLLGIDYDIHPGPVGNILDFRLMYFPPQSVGIMPWCVNDPQDPNLLWVRTGLCGALSMDLKSFKELEKLVCQQPTNPIDDPQYVFRCDLSKGWGSIFTVLSSPATPTLQGNGFTIGTPAQNNVYPASTASNGSTVVTLGGLDYFVYETPPVGTAQSYKLFSFPAQSSKLFSFPTMQILSAPTWFYGVFSGPYYVRVGVDSVFCISDHSFKALQGLVNTRSNLSGYADIDRPTEWSFMNVGTGTLSIQIAIDGSKAPLNGCGKHPAQGGGTYTSPVAVAPAATANQFVNTSHPGVFAGVPQFYTGTYTTHTNSKTTTEEISDILADRTKRLLSQSCDCGAKKTFGAKDYDHSHSDWCSVASEKKSIPVSLLK